ncbi:DUF4922 domain-containing protein [Vibrio sp. SS-MA-C1-2]|uniref:DUF4922 domain-containing protein n=1 Tax=Vibrio sp. SS-MA-C1-2 TaxID=2908646 RepID=UPI001F242753|nr:DUF4922 domain-containing protein [Vibrio sp. SS-MA-C1-2]UJF18492.1 DUF4922 domain-containing protein [Vibrio sp. SS-MA-C1-2]
MDDTSQLKRTRISSKQLDALYNNALINGYLSREALEGNERLHFFDVNDEIDYRIQINHVRSRYSKSVVGVKKLPLPDEALCAICKENIGSKGKENLEHLTLQLGDDPYFIQLTPFPLYHHHFVLISEQHQPMTVSVDSFKKQLQFLDQFPEYTVCSNSDREGAGASILSHLHFQVFKKLRLPIFDTQAKASFHREEVEYSLCQYPMTVIKIQSKSGSKHLAAFNHVLSTWRQDSSENTFNLATRKNNGMYETFIILRNAKFNTPEPLLKYKYEGVGVIEACGEGILPTPEGEEAEELNENIRLEGRIILKDILTSLNPLTEKESSLFFDLL